ncbi:MAG: hypothetical protein AB1487_00045 [Thermodesulfobacteriota bacterium]
MRDEVMRRLVFNLLGCWASADPFTAVNIPTIRVLDDTLVLQSHASTSSIDKLEDRKVRSLSLLVSWLAFIFIGKYRLNSRFTVGLGNAPKIISYYRFLHVNNGRANSNPTPRRISELLGEQKLINQ